MNVNLTKPTEVTTTLTINKDVITLYDNLTKALNHPTLTLKGRETITIIKANIKELEWYYQNLQFKNTLSKDLLQRIEERNANCYKDFELLATKDGVVQQKEVNNVSVLDLDMNSTEVKNLITEHNTKYKILNEEEQQEFKDYIEFLNSKLTLQFNIKYLSPELAPDDLELYNLVEQIIK